MSTLCFSPGTQAYSYLRFSNPEQLKGDSVRRQLEGTQQWADELGIPLNTQLRDLGLSAFRGAHRTKGDLGKFLSLVQRGEISRGSVLIIESLDRLSREQVLDALNQFISLINAGIVIGTLADQQIYSRETLGNDWSKLIISLTIMARAHEESAMKSQRLTAAWEEKRRSAPTKPMTARCPEWLKLEEGQFKIVDERQMVVRRIFFDAIAGFGKRRTAGRLNRDGTPAFRGKDGWHPSSVGKILSNEAVLGRFQPHRMVNGKRIPDGPPLDGYYPPVIDEATFWQAQEAIKARRHRAAGRKGEADANLFSPELNS
jgi:DNA invertase Pin-like site-specific DNA recombinase